MTLTEIFDFTIRQCGQHITNTNNLEIKETPFLDLIEYTLGDYEEYFPLTDTFQLTFNGTRQFRFVEGWHKYGLPKKIHSVSPVHYPPNNALFLYTRGYRWLDRFKTNKYLESKTEFPWTYEESNNTLYVPFDCRATVKATFGYKQESYVEREFNNVSFKSSTILTSFNDYDIVFNGVDTIKTIINNWVSANSGQEVTYDSRYEDQVLGAGTLIFETTDVPTYNYPDLAIRKDHIFFKMITAEFADQLGMARDTYVMSEMPIEVNSEQLRAFADKLREQVNEDLENKSKFWLGYKK